MDSSMGAANNAVLDCLQGAGDIGLHVDDIMKMLGFEERKQILPRMYDLQGRGMVERLPGQKWKFLKPMQATSVPDLSVVDVPPGTENAPNATNPADAEANSFFSTAPPLMQHSVTPPVKKAIKKPAANPQGNKFISYKNTLQEYCQKKHLPIPRYRTERTDFGYIGTVTFSSQTMKSQVATPSVKEAEQRVAFEALKNAQVLPQDAQFNVPVAPSLPAKKRKSSNSGDLTSPPSKVQNVEQTENASHKSQLNEIAQKNKLPIPKYEMISHGFLFAAIVQFQERTFRSCRPFAKKKEAEQNAAHVALYELGHTADQPVGWTAESDAKDNKPWWTVGGSMTQQCSNGATADATQAATSSTPSNQPHVTYKNKLQECMQKKKSPMPSYTTVWVTVNGPPGFICTLNVEDMQYQSERKQVKKEAEQDAARIALVSLGLITE